MVSAASAGARPVWKYADDYLRLYNRSDMRAGHFGVACEHAEGADEHDDLLGLGSVDLDIDIICYSEKHRGAYSVDLCPFISSSSIWPGLLFRFFHQSYHLFDLGVM